MPEDYPRAVEQGNSVQHRVDRPIKTWFLLHPHDQGTVAFLLVGTLFLVTSVWFAHGGAHGDLLEWDPAIRSGLTFQLDVNRADWVEFALLPGIGEKLAQKIVTFRSERGPFEAKADLLQVPGIGPKKLAAIEPYLLIHDVIGEASPSSTERELKFESAAKVPLHVHDAKKHPDVTGSARGQHQGPLAAEVGSSSADSIGKASRADKGHRHNRTWP